jgi:hypothetical protein
MNEFDEDYEEPTPRKPDKISKARTYIQLIVEQYEPCFIWDNSTYFKDRGLLYFKCNQFANKFSDTKLVIVLQWAKCKNLHVKQFIKTLNKISTGED